MSHTTVWSSKSDEILIDFVRNHAFIYDVKNKYYKKPELKQNAWAEIGTLLNKTDNDCSKRWVYIRDYYIRRKGKPGTGYSGEAAKKRHDLLSFLDSCSSTKRSTIVNIPESEIDIKLENTPSEIEQTSSEQINFIQPTFILDQAEENYPDDIKISRTSRKRKVSNSEVKVDTLNQIIEKQEQESEHETDLFFASMSKIVKKLPRYEQAQLRMQIGNLVGNAELSYLSSNQREYRDTTPTLSRNSNYSDTWEEKYQVN